jgi:hypothetical protein
MTTFNLENLSRLSQSIHKYLGPVQSSVTQPQAYLAAQTAHPSYGYTARDMDYNYAPAAPYSAPIHPERQAMLYGGSSQYSYPPSSFSNAAASGCPQYLNNNCSFYAYQSAPPFTHQFPAPGSEFTQPFTSSNYTNSTHYAAGSNSNYYAANNALSSCEQLKQLLSGSTSSFNHHGYHQTSQKLPLQQLPISFDLTQPQTNLYENVIHNLLLASERKRTNTSSNHTTFPDCAAISNSFDVALHNVASSHSSEYLLKVPIPATMVSSLVTETYPFTVVMRAQEEQQCTPATGASKEVSVIELLPVYRWLEKSIVYAKDPARRGPRFYFEKSSQSDLNKASPYLCLYVLGSRTQLYITLRVLCAAIEFLSWQPPGTTLLYCDLEPVLEQEIKLHWFDLETNDWRNDDSTAINNNTTTPTNCNDALFLPSGSNSAFSNVHNVHSPYSFVCAQHSGNIASRNCDTLLFARLIAQQLRLSSLAATSNARYSYSISSRFTNEFHVQVDLSNSANNNSVQLPIPNTLLLRHWLCELVKCRELQSLLAIHSLYLLQQPEFTATTSNATEDQETEDDVSSTSDLSLIPAYFYLHLAVLVSPTCPEPSVATTVRNLVHSPILNLISSLIYFSGQMIIDSNDESNDENVSTNSSLELPQVLQLLLPSLNVCWRNAMSSSLNSSSLVLEEAQQQQPQSKQSVFCSLFPQQIRSTGNFDSLSGNANTTIGLASSYLLCPSSQNNSHPIQLCLNLSGAAYEGILSALLADNSKTLFALEKQLVNYTASPWLVEVVQQQTYLKIPLVSIISNSSGINNSSGTSNTSTNSNKQTKNALISSAALLTRQCVHILDAILTAAGYTSSQHSNTKRDRLSSSDDTTTQQHDFYNSKKVKRRERDYDANETNANESTALLQRTSLGFVTPIMTNRYTAT